ncbi:DEKNAAC101817 [Brettanomyces naardenensis]|uniref:DNA replication complex GINS protein PSF3 n=1 Tax=Brettanomyces naardenensis TaxID=13370 RepID=A0A448YJ52_BRENA|nr:DEKNAAC101817 [Brettanomyces naardenensis]
MELPMWLADILAVCAAQNDDGIDNAEENAETQAFIRLIEPEFFSKQFLNFIKSDTLKVNLAPFAYYYKIVAKWSYMFNDTELVELISKMFVARASEINGLSYKLNDQFSGDNQEFLNGLENFEKRLFKMSHLSYKDMNNWIAKG